MGKRKKRREHCGSCGRGSNSSDTKLVSSVLNETNTVLHGETVMQSSAQLNAPVQHLATSTPVMNSQQQYMQMFNSPILSSSLNQAHVHNVPPPPTLGSRSGELDPKCRSKGRSCFKTITEIREGRGENG